MQDSKVDSEAMSFAFAGAVTDVFAYARVLNINIEQSEEEVRFALSLLARRTKDKPNAPEVFMEGLKSATMRKKYNVLIAIDGGFLILNKNNNSISLSANPHDPIYTAVMGKDVVDGLVGLLSTDNGQRIYDAILDFNQPFSASESKAELNLPTKEVMEQSKADNKTKTAVLQDLEESDAELLDMLKLAKDNGIVEFKLPMWYSYRDDKFPKEEGFLNGLKSNPAMYKSFKYDLAKIQG